MSETEREEPEAAEVRMSFGEHLDELRRRIVHALYGVVIGVAICIWNMFTIFEWIIRPYRLAVESTGGVAVFNPLQPQEVFMTYITLSIQAALVLTSPWIIYQLWTFVAAGLYPRERKVVYRYMGPSCVLFLMGVAFFYFIVLPMTLSFFLSFASHSAGPRPVPNVLERALLRMGRQDTAAATQPVAATAPATAPEGGGLAARLPVLTADPADPAAGEALLYYHAGEKQVKLKVGGEVHRLMRAEQGSLFLNQWRAKDYLTFVAFASLVFGLAFEMPMVILILAQTGIVRTEKFREVRKYAYFGILVLAVAIAPSGDFLTLMFLFVPLIALYEIGIIVSALVVREPRDASGEPQEPEDIA